MPFRPAAMTPPPATLQSRRSSRFDSASRRGGPSGFPAVRAPMDGGGDCSVGNKLPGASAAVSTNFANCLIFFGQENKPGLPRRSQAKAGGIRILTQRREDVEFFMTRISRIHTN
jgi:hypothetical protein